jgi:hypothetical protein
MSRFLTDDQLNDIKEIFEYSGNNEAYEVGFELLMEYQLLRDNYKYLLEVHNQTIASIEPPKD